MECLEAAVKAGADAIYLGGRSFSARKNAANFTDEQLVSAIDYCHAHGVSVYVAVNTLYKDSELHALLRFVHFAAEAGADAFILQDIGAATEIHRLWPDIKLHASTQMTVQNADDLRFLHKFGFCRAVLSRELSLDDIAKITAETLSFIETEVFVHGALCVSFSGQCMMSHCLGGDATRTGSERSGNRGSCAQPCRLPYDLIDTEERIASGYLLSPRDLCAQASIDELYRLGVSSFKIEGRMKSPEYVALITHKYKSLIDKKIPAGFSDRDLLQIFNRGGSFTDGYLKHHAGKDMMSTQSPKSTGALAGYIANVSANAFTMDCVTDIVPGDGLEIWTENEPHPGTAADKHAAAGSRLSVSFYKSDPRKVGIKPGDPVYKSFDKDLDRRIKAFMTQSKRSIEVEGSFYGKVGDTAHLTLTRGDISVTAKTSAPPEPAREPDTSGSLTDTLKLRLSKTGNDDIAINWRGFEADTSAFYPVSLMNSLRREVVGMFIAAWIGSYKRELKAPALPDPINSITPQPIKSITPPYDKRLVVSAGGHFPALALQLEAMLLPDVARIVVESYAIDAAVHNPDFDIYTFMSDFSTRCHELGITLCVALNRNGAFAEYSFADGYYLRTWGQLHRAADLPNKIICTDYTFNAFNTASIECLSSYSVNSVDVNTVVLGIESEPVPIEHSDAFGIEYVIYGRIPMMYTRQCPVGNYTGRRASTGLYCSLHGIHEADSPDKYALKDRKGAMHPLIRDCETCSCIILNEKRLDRTTVKAPEGIQFYRLMFWDESPSQIRNELKLRRIQCSR